MTPDEHAAQAREMLAAATHVHNEMFGKLQSGELPGDVAMPLMALTAALAQVHATLSLRQSDDPPRHVPYNEDLPVGDLDATNDTNDGTVDDDNRYWAEEDAAFGREQAAREQAERAAFVGHAEKDTIAITQEPPHDQPQRKEHE